jgi:hypothetical protein
VARAKRPKALLRGDPGARPNTYKPIPRFAAAVAMSKIQLIGAAIIDLAGTL